MTLTTYFDCVQVYFLQEIILNLILVELNLISLPNVTFLIYLRVECFSIHNLMYLKQSLCTIQDVVLDAYKDLQHFWRNEQI